MTALLQPMALTSREGTPGFSSTTRPWPGFHLTCLYTLIAPKKFIEIMAHIELKETVTELPVCKSRFARERFLFNPVSRETVQINCKSWRCEVHQKNWLHKWRAVASWQLARHPVDRLVTLTFAEDCKPSQMIRAKKLLLEDLRLLYGKVEYLSVLEFTTLARLPHLHMLWYSTFIPQSELSYLWARATLLSGLAASPVVYIEKPRAQDGAAFYALKYALSGAEKGQAIPDDWDGRKVTYSENFFEKSVASIWKEIIELWLDGKESPGKFELRDRLKVYDLYPQLDNWRNGEIVPVMPKEKIVTQLTESRLEVVLD